MITNPRGNVSLLAALFDALSGGRGWTLSDTLMAIHPDALLIFETETCRASNHRASALTGYTPNELIGLRVDDLFPQRDMEAVARALRLASSGMGTARGVTLLTRNGTGRPVDLTAMSIDAKRVVMAIRDAVPRLEREEREAERRRRSEALLQLARLGADPPPYLDWDMVMGMLARATGVRMALLFRRDGNCMRRVGAYEPMPQFPSTLYDGEYVVPDVPRLWTIGHPPSSLLAESAADSGLGRLSERPVDGGGALLTVGYISRGPTVEDDLFLDAATSHVDSMLKHIRAASQAKSLSALLDRVEAQVGALLSSATCGLLLTDEDLKIVSANRMACDMLGYPTGSLVGHHIEDVLALPGSLVEVMRYVLATGTAGQTQETVIIRRDGEQVPVRLRVAPIGEGSPASGIAIGLEDRRRMLEIEAERRRLDNLALLGQMIAVLAHEIRTPLATIYSILQILDSNTADDSEVHRKVELALDAARRLRGMVDKILRRAKENRPEMRLTDVAVLVRGILQRWKPRLEREGVEVQITVAGELPPVLIDGGQFEQVMNNLISNALQAMDGKSEKSIGLRISKTDVTVDGIRRPGVAVQVADSGHGMSGEVMSNLFKLFFTTKRAGTGLGLKIARRIIRDHGGDIEVQSWEGTGTIFTITLPAADVNAQRSEVADEDDGISGRR